MASCCFCIVSLFHVPINPIVPISKCEGISERSRVEKTAEKRSAGSRYATIIRFGS